MIRTHIIRENKKPVAVIMDYKEYVRLKEIEHDGRDYYSAANTKGASKKCSAPT